MNFFIFLGPPGAGKGTQSSLLQQRLGFTHVSTGDIIRKEISTGTELGLKVKKTVESGHFVDDSTILNCLSSHLDRLSDVEKKVVLLDGIPRNALQAKALDDKYQHKIKGVLALTADVELLVERFQKRRLCKACGRIVSLNNSVKNASVCSNCGEKNQLIRRKDDEPSVVRERFKVYASQTESLLEFYTKRKILYQFDALESVEKIYVFLANCILEKIDGKY